MRGFSENGTSKAVSADFRAGVEEQLRILRGDRGSVARPRRGSWSPSSLESRMRSGFFSRRSFAVGGEGIGVGREVGNQRSAVGVAGLRVTQSIDV